IGERARIHVSGTFSTGLVADITSQAATTLTTGDAKVVNVDPSGLITAVGSGKTSVTVRNGNFSISIPATVPGCVRGDLNCDGKVDQDDLNLLVAAVGMTVSGAFDARDLNGDGVIDDKDTRIVQGICSPACVTGGHFIPVNGVVNAASFVTNA